MRHVFVLTCAVLLLPGWVLAGGGDDHSHGPVAAQAAAATAAAPRVEATSELFELVGVVDGDKLVIHLDRYASNEPVTGASIAVEGGPLKSIVAEERDGVYTVTAAGLAAAGLIAPGTHSLVFTVLAGETSDLLTGDLVVAGAVADAAHADRPDWHALRTPMLGVLAVVVALAAGFAGYAIGRRRKSAHLGAVQ